MFDNFNDKMVKNVKGRGADPDSFPKRPNNVFVCVLGFTRGV